MRYWGAEQTESPTAFNVRASPQMMFFSRINCTALANIPGDLPPLAIQARPGAPRREARYSSVHKCQLPLKPPALRLFSAGRIWDLLGADSDLALRIKCNNLIKCGPRNRVCYSSDPIGRHLFGRVKLVRA